MPLYGLSPMGAPRAINTGIFLCYLALGTCCVTFASEIYLYSGSATVHMELLEKTCRTGPVQALHRLYRPLSKERKEVRLLHIESLRPNLEAFRNQLVCRLEHVSLLDNPSPKYEAVSWCWGDSNQKAGIMLENHVIEVSKNAEEVLRHLCYKHGHCTVWLDAVCINQADLNERGHQVSMMRDVYSMAERTLVWLGPDTGCTKIAFETLDVMYQHCMDNTAGYFDQIFWDERGNFVYSTDPLPQCNWHAIGEFFAAAWFFRLWAVQEVLLSKEVICYQGHHSRPWSQIALAAQWMNHRQYWRNEYCNGNIDGIFSASRVWSTGTIDTRLRNLLAMSIDKQATEGVDNVYGLLGLVDYMDVDEIAAAGLAPDYNADTIDVCRNATRKAILEDQGRPYQLLLLYYAHALVPPRGTEAATDPADERRRPTWVPRFDWVWDCKYGSPSNIQPFGSGAANGIGGDAYFLDQDRNVMRAKGIIIDCVSATSRRWNDELIWEDDKLLAKEVLECRSMVAGIGKKEDELAMTLVCGLDSERRVIDRHSCIYGQFDRFLADCESTVQGSNTSISGENFHDERRDEGHTHTMRHFGMRIGQRSYNRHFFATDNGYIGMGPPGIEDGDFIVIIFGSILPLAMRRDGKYWSLLGTAYVHDIMSGEFIRKLESTGQLEESIQYFDIH